MTSKATGPSGHSSFELLAAVGLTLLASFFLLRSPSPSTPYNDAPLSTPTKNADGSVTHSLYMITDLDQDSKVADKKSLWHSLALRGSLTVGPGQKAFLSLGETTILNSQIAAGGRSMELSDLAVFNGELVTCDDRTGLLYHLDAAKSKAFPWVFLPDGPGIKSSKGLKAEWMTVKDGSLYVGGLGKEWTTTTGEYVNDNPMWIKVVSPEGGVHHVNWADVFKAARATIGIQYPGYAIHEAVQYSAKLGRWFFLPRRASTETYSEEADEFRGTNQLISATADFKDWKAVTVGDKGNGARGFSAFQFIPGTGDQLIVALKSEEKDGKPVASYLSVFRVDGTIVLPDTQLEGAHKYEGIAFA